MGKMLDKQMRVDAQGRLVVEGLTPNHTVRVTVEDSADAVADVVDWGKYRGKLIKYERPFDPVEPWPEDIEPHP